MKIILGLLMFSLFIIGCTYNQDGGRTIGAFGSPAWLKFAPHKDLVNYYSMKDIDELCKSWKSLDNSSEYKRVRNRKAIKEVLRDNGEDDLICMKLQNT